MKPEIKIATSPEELSKAVADYYQVAQEIKLLEDKKKALRPILEAHVVDGLLSVGEYIVNATDVSRENFNLKNARSELTKAILTKLAPFISVTQFKQIRVVYRGGERE